MSSNLFPIIQPDIDLVQPLDMYKEIKWDYENNIPIFNNGIPVVVTGVEAIKVWVWRTLQTPRYRYQIYTWDYGSEIESLIGAPFSEALKQSEVERYLKECLLINPYIIDISDVVVNFEGDKFRIECTIVTVYGEVKVNV